MQNIETLPYLKGIKEAGTIFGLSYNKMKKFVMERENNGLNQYIYQFSDTKPNCKIYIDVKGFANWIDKQRASNRS